MSVEERHQTSVGKLQQQRMRAARCHAHSNRRISCEQRRFTRKRVAWLQWSGRGGGLSLKGAMCHDEEGGDGANCKQTKGTNACDVAVQDEAK